MSINPILKMIQRYSKVISPRLYEFFLDYLYLYLLPKNARAFYKKNFNSASSPFTIDYESDVGIVFFCGIGDLIYGIPALKEIKKQTIIKGLKLYAFTTIENNATSNKSNFEIIKKLNIFDDVFTYMGNSNSYWKYYDWTALSNSNFSKIKLYPFIYKTNKKTKHRIESVANQFSLKIKNKDFDNETLLHFLSLKSKSIELIALKLKMQNNILFLHFDTRSGSYVHPNFTEIVTNLIQSGYTVITTTKTKKRFSRNFIFIDPHLHSIFDTLYLICSVNAFVIAINSLIWPLAMLKKCKLLAFHYLISDDVHQFFYPKMILHTPSEYSYNKLRHPNVHLMSENFHFTKCKQNNMQIDIHQNYILNCIYNESPITQST